MIALSGVMGCATPRQAVKPRANFDARSEGYTLLYELLSQERNVDKLLLVKLEKSDLGKLIETVARGAGDSADELKAIGARDPTLSLKAESLPEVEVKTRAAISQARTKQLLFSNGQQFELALLLTQAEALNYGTYLAKTLAQGERNRATRLQLEVMSRRLETLHESVIKFLGERRSGK